MIGCRRVNPGVTKVRVPMRDKTFRLDMAMMYAVHNALRRELERIARITARPEDDPRHILRTAVGWELFKNYLRVHHVSEDDRNNTGAAAPRYLPWLLDSASEKITATILGRMVEPLRNAYRDEWRKAYVALDLWTAKDEQAAI